jgi:hypothetical protein
LSNEVYLKQTEKTVGQLLPVLVNKKGEIIDGKHRTKSNPRWKKLVLPLNPLQTHIARLVINTQRRITDDNEYNDVAKLLQNTEKGKEPYLVKSGKTIAKRIEELSGIPSDTVLEHLDSKYKDPVKSVAGGTPTELGEGERIRVPDSLAPRVKKLIESVKKAVAASPEQKDEILASVKNHVETGRKDLQAAVKAHKILNTVTENETHTNEGPLSELLDRYSTFSEKGKIISIIESQGTPEAINILRGDRKKQGRPISEKEAKDIILGLEPVNATEIVGSIIRRMSLVKYTCKVCRQEQELERQNLKFSITRPDLKKLEEDLAGAQTKLKELVEK